MLLILVATATATTFGSTQLTLPFRNDLDEIQVILFSLSEPCYQLNKCGSTFIPTPIKTGTFKFFYEGQRLLQQDTPASVRWSTMFSFDLTHRRVHQHNMESGDMIDAHLEQVRTGVTLPVYPLSQILVICYPNSSEAGINTRIPLLLASL